MKRIIRNSWVVGIVIIFILALGLRTWGINFGLPYPYHIDEPMYVSSALNLGGELAGKQDVTD